MTMKFIKTEKDADGSRSISVLMYIGATEYKGSVMGKLTWMLATGTLLLAFLAYFSVLKYRRVQRETNEFKIMQKTF